jgi:hypothetical protein
LFKLAHPYAKIIRLRKAVEGIVLIGESWGRVVRNSLADSIIRNLDFFPSSGRLLTWDVDEMVLNDPS